MKTPLEYQEELDAATDRLQGQIESARLGFARKLREEVLLPFCRKYRLEFETGPYCDRFIDLEDDEIYDHYELRACKRLANRRDPMIDQITDYIRLMFMRDHVIQDYQWEAIDIREKDL